MKTYTITVNGAAYEVTVEEGGMGQNRPVPTIVQPVVQTENITSPQAQAPKASEPTPVASNGSKGSITINSPMPGKILNIKVKIGDHVEKGDVVLLLEAMKMENEIVASHEGTIASIEVHGNDNVEAGDVLVTLN